MDNDALNSFLKSIQGKYTVKLDDVIQSTLAQTLFNSYLLEQTLKTQLEIKAMLENLPIEDANIQERMRGIIKRAEENTAKSVHELMIGMYLDNNPG